MKAFGDFRQDCLPRALHGLCSWSLGLIGGTFIPKKWHKHARHTGGILFLAGAAALAARQLAIHLKEKRDRA